MLLGDALLVGPVDDNGWDTSVPADYQTLLFDTSGRLRVELVDAERGRRWQPVDHLWSDPFTAYADGLQMAQAWPRASVQLLLA
ncbi:hypothetical protein MXD61_05160 [Frankia sp. AgPm24]|uniref:hypothetical protein n=1 Tax=Frankia sp. AgPm24 TaxID=631128 RepID=UPI00200DF03F|nr:hypothetical protein [Frankia sp. AgPm24]MCK9921295.1 hypothetical protein [Frankia sp. AgPm24]